MAVKKLIVVRHALRLDSVDKSWKLSSPTPYDPPLSHPLGIDQAKETGNRISQILLSSSGSQNAVYIHSSPFLRCVETAAIIANRLQICTNQEHEKNVTIRLDAILGEWLTPDYFTSIDPPPPDNHQSLALSSQKWLATQSVNVDEGWSLDKLGTGGEYGESWSSMHARFGQGVQSLVRFYGKESIDTTVIIVTHGAGCNALLGNLSNQPLLSRINLASFAVYERNDSTSSWDISYNSSQHSNDESETEYLKTPVLSGSSTSTSSSSVSELFNNMHTTTTNSTHTTPIIYSSLQTNHTAKKYSTDLGSGFSVIPSAKSKDTFKSDGDTNSDMFTLSFSSSYSINNNNNINNEDRNSHSFPSKSITPTASSSSSLSTAIATGSTADDNDSVWFKLGGNQL